MSEYKGKISGIGNRATRFNEITADDLAILRYYQIGWDYGVVNRQGYNFFVDTDKHKGTSSIEVGKGIMFAYGYVGYVDNSVFEFIRPAIPQYHIIYVELDRSKIPNTCTLKVKNNQSSTSIERTFRQDYLDKVRTGIFQLPIWRVKVGSNGIQEVFDLRVDLDLLKPSIKQVEYAPYCKRVFGSIKPGATATTQPITDNSQKIATTEFVRLTTRSYIDGYLPITGDVAWKFNFAIQGTSDIRIFPPILIFEKEKYIYKKEFVVTCPDNVSVRFSLIENENARIVEEEIVVKTDRGTKYIAVPIEVDTLDVNDVEETIIIQQT